METGFYDVARKVTIRKNEPRIISYSENGKWITNSAGTYNPGRRVEIKEIHVDDKTKDVWGRVSETDSQGLALWVCIQNINGNFLDKVPDVAVPANSLDERVGRMEAFLKAKLGYKP